MAADRFETSHGADREVSLRFGALLARLGEDGTPAGVAYEQLRRRLILLFRLHVPMSAEELADVALDRLARRLHEGTPIDDPRLYALGIARKLLLEEQGRAAREQRMAADPSLLPASVDNDEDAAETTSMLAAVSACLDRLGAANRALILAYYGADGAARIALRQRLAAELGISVNALRNRALRLRETLARCTRERLHGSAKTP